MDPWIQRTLSFGYLNGLLSTWRPYACHYVIQIHINWPTEKANVQWTFHLSIGPMDKQNSNGYFQVHWIFHLSIRSNGHAKVQWTIRDPFDKWNVQWPFDISIGHLAWVLDINQRSGMHSVNTLVFYFGVKTNPAWKVIRYSVNGAIERRFQFNIYIDYVRVDECVRFLFTSCERPLNKRVSI
jgi:hypothetical protein